MESAKNIVNEDNNSFTGGIQALEKNNITVNNLEMEKLYEDVQVILNHLTKFQNSTYLVDQFVRLPINTKERLYDIVNLFFDKAVNEPSFTKVCASFCGGVCGVKGISIKNGLELNQSFRKTLVSMCQTEFEGFTSEIQNTEKQIKEIKDYNGMDQNDEKQKKLFKRNLGTVRFIGELYNSNVVTTPIIYACMQSLINPLKETFLEYLYTLLTTTGKYLEEQMAVNVRRKKGLLKYNSTLLDLFFKRITSIVQQQQNSKVSLRVRLMLEDLITLRQNNWVSATK